MEEYSMYFIYFIELWKMWNLRQFDEILNHLT